MDVLIEQFTREAERTDARVRTLAGWSEVAGFVLDLSAGGGIAVAPSVLTAASAFVGMLGEGGFVPNDGDAVERVADLPVGVVRAVAAVAETGSVLIFEETMADRAVSMLTRTLVAVVERKDLVEDLFALRPFIVPRSAPAPRYAALVTGPSRTADIERSLTIGVQGPGEVYVVILP